MSNKEIVNFDKYMETNPRYTIPNKEIREFLEYAKIRYSKYLKVNCCHQRDSEEQYFEVSNYVGECAELLLLFSEWKNKQKAKQGLLEIARREGAKTELEKFIQKLNDNLEYYNYDSKRFPQGIYEGGTKEIQELKNYIEKRLKELE